MEFPNVFAAILKTPNEYKTSTWKERVCALVSMRPLKLKPCLVYINTFSFHCVSLCKKFHTYTMSKSKIHPYKKWISASRGLEEKHLDDDNKCCCCSESNERADSLEKIQHGFWRYWWVHGFWWLRKVTFSALKITQEINREVLALKEVVVC